MAGTVARVALEKHLTNFIPILFLRIFAIWQIPAAG